MDFGSIYDINESRSAALRSSPRIILKLTIHVIATTYFVSLYRVLSGSSSLSRSTMSFSVLRSNLRYSTIDTSFRSR